MGRVAHFEIRAKDPEKVVSFYEKVFGWEIQKWEDGPNDYWLVHTGEMKNGIGNQKYGIDGGITTGFPFEDDGKINGYVNTMDVSDIEAIIKKVVVNGGKVVAEKVAVVGVGWLCYCQDVEGNYFGLMEADENAG